MSVDDVTGFDALVRLIPGLVIGVFDRACVYTMVRGGLVENLAVGRHVGALNPECGEVLLGWARRAIHAGERTEGEVTFRGRVLSVRVAPYQHPQFGIVGGILGSWDVTERLRSSRPPPP